MKADNGVRHNVLRRLYTQYRHRHPLFDVPPSTEAGIQTGTKSTTDKGGNYREWSSITDHQSDPLQRTYSQNIPDDRRSRAGATGVQSEVRPASSSGGHSQRGQSFEREQSRGNYRSRSQDAAQSRNSYYKSQVIMRKSFGKEATRPFRQHSSQSWHPEDAPKSYNEEKVLGNDSPEVQQPFGSALSSPYASRYWGPSLRYSSYNETNRLAAADPWRTSSKIQSSRFFSSSSKTAPHDASLIKNNPSTTDFSQRLHSTSSSETPRYEKVQPYPFQHSQIPFSGHGTPNLHLSTITSKQRPSDAQVYGRLSSNLEQSQQSGRDKPRKEYLLNFNHASPLHHHAKVAQHGGQTASFTKYQHSATADTQAHPAPRSENSAARSTVNATAAESVHEPGRTTKPTYGSRGFKNPTWRAMKEPSSLSSSSSNERIDSGRNRVNKGRLKVASLYPSLSPKYSFGQRDAVSKPERTTTDYSRLPSGTLDIVLKITSPRPLFPLGFEKAQREGDAGMDRNPNRKQFKLSKRINGQKEFGIRPLEGAKPLSKEPDKSARLQHSFEGFKRRSSQMWQPESNRIHRRYNKTEAGSSHGSTVSDLKPHSKTAGSAEAHSRFTPGKYRKNRKIYTHLGFQPVQKRTGNSTSKAQNPTTTSASPRISSTYPRSGGGLEAGSNPTSEPGTPNKTKVTEMRLQLFNSSTRGLVRGTRVRGKKPTGAVSPTGDARNITIVRLPKELVKLRAVTYSDILGSASFTGVTATIQTPVTLAVEGYFPNATATTEQKEGAGHRTLTFEDALNGGGNVSGGPGGNVSRGPEAHAEGEAGFSSVEENKLAIGGGEADSDADAPDRDEEGSGGSLKLSGDLLELDYLKISTGNISFNSVKQSHTQT